MYLSYINNSVSESIVLGWISTTQNMKMKKLIF
jgi:hypothetical protein